MSWFHINTFLHGQRAGGPNNGHACLMHWQAPRAGGQIRYAAHAPAPPWRTSVDVKGRPSLSVNLPPALSNSPSTMLLNFNVANAV